VTSRLQTLQSRWWWPALLIWAATRALSTSLFLIVGYLQDANYWTPAHPGYFDFLNIWDVEWYHRIFDHGYPSVLPTNPDGSAQQNEWAFMPAFPFLVRAINAVTGIEWKYLAPILATVFGFIAAALIYRLLTRVMPKQTALWSLALMGLWCASPTLQSGYAESMALALLAWALLLIHDRKYLLALIPTALMSVTRPGVLALAVALAMIFADRFWYSRKTPSDFPLRERIELFVAGITTAALGLVWSWVSALATGRSDAYISTELAWRVGYTGTQNFVPFQSWLISANWFWPGITGVIVLVILVALVVWSIFTKSVISLGLTMRSWIAAYWVYLFVFFYPQSSLFRILIPAFPMLAALGVSTAKAGRLAKAGIVLSFTVLQLCWLLTCWMYTAPDFSPP
jgi:hypothetical protein